MSLFLPFLAHGQEAAGPTCVEVGRWLDPATGKTLEHRSLIAETAGRAVVLLGEQHAIPEHHRWQLHTIAALHALNPHMVLGLEMFPRRLQPVLDRWVAGELDEKQFLEESDWNEVWRYDPDMYLPIFHFARSQGLPMIAINVEKAMVAKVRRQGWQAVEEGEREGVTDPAPADQAYVEGLAQVYALHQMESMGQHGADAAEEPPPVDLDDPEFLGFVAAQLTWDRAMAQALADARGGEGGPLVVGIVGSGHVEYGFGISHQLADLGVHDVTVMLPWGPDRQCEELAPAGWPAIADAVFGVAEIAPAEPSWRPLLGVIIENGDGGVLITRVLDDSVAATTGLRADDLIVEAAGYATTRTAELVTVIQRQAPGTWLPLEVRRGGETIELVAKFRHPE